MTQVEKERWLSETHEKIKKLVGGNIPEDIWNAFWNMLANEGHIETALEEEEIEKNAGYKYLVDEMKKKCAVYRIVREKTNNPEKPKIPKTQEEKIKNPDKRSWAFSEIMSVLLNHREDIIKFRQKYLNNSLLSPEEVPKWIEEKAKDMPPTLTFSFDVEGGEGWENRLLEKVQAFIRKLPCKDVRSEITTLEYIDPPCEWVKRVTINQNGPLGELKKIASKLSDYFGEAAAVSFILTGKPLPSFAGVKVRTTLTPFGLSKITIEASPHLDPEDVAKVFTKTKKEYKKFYTPQRKISDKHLTLAVFVVQEKGTWQKLMEKWNKKYPHWQYKDKRTFARDSKAAFYRITGLKWH